MSEMMSGLQNLFPFRPFGSDGNAVAGQGRRDGTTGQRPSDMRSAGPGTRDAIPLASGRTLRDSDADGLRANRGPASEKTTRLTLVPVTFAHLGLGLWVIIARELSKFFRQRERLISSLVRPLLWLLVFATGMHDLLGVSIIEPYRTYTPYQEYVLPGLVGVVVLFQSMQSALSLVYDREAGVMRVMLVTPLPRGWLLFAKIAAAATLALGQAVVFLAVAALLGIHMPWATVWLAIPAALLAGLMLGAIGLVVTVYTRQIENFAGMMNFVIFPMFFLSSALYPLWKLREAGADVIWYLAMANPFTHAVELMRFAAYGRMNWVALAVVLGTALLAFALAVRGYNPQVGTIGKLKRG
jgi:ABC-2 type transport system permease protein